MISEEEHKEIIESFNSLSNNDKIEWLTKIDNKLNEMIEHIDNIE